MSFTPDGVLITWPGGLETLTSPPGHHDQPGPGTDHVMSRNGEAAAGLEQLRRYALSVGTYAIRLAASAGDEETAARVRGEMTALGLLAGDGTGNLVPGSIAEAAGADGHMPEGR
jgi:hypothetical protein